MNISLTRSASVALYQLSVENVAVNANRLSDPNLFVQQGENRSRGLEAEAGGNILPNLSMMLCYVYCDAKVTKSDIAWQVGTTVRTRQAIPVIVG
jgi:iron complex outermembrane receptor protein